MASVTMRELLEAGVHFGHRTRRWNPKMRPYIFTERSGVHIIDLQQTMQRTNQYAEMASSMAADGKTILFVGTKRQAQATLKQEADRCKMPYVNQRWLGGTLTNWATIRKRIDYLLKLEREIDAGAFRNLSKKEQLSIDRQVTKLNYRLGGLKTMTKIPDMLFVVDTHSEDLAIREARKMKVPILGMVDTNTNPDSITHVIPSNDDAIRSIKLIVTVMASAIEEGINIREIDHADTGKVSKNELDDMKKYLGPSTLAKLQTEDGEIESEVAAPSEDATAVEVIGDGVDIEDAISMIESDDS